MKRYTVGSLLLMSTLLLWQWHSAQPLLDGTLPHLSISSQYTDLYIPISEVLAGCLSFLTIFSAFRLFWVVADYKLTYGRAVVFLVCAYMIASGSGMHVACVTTELNILDGNMEADSLSTLIHFMHEYWSHTSFVSGFFAMMLFISWTEVAFESVKTKHTVGKQVDGQTKARFNVEKDANYKSTSSSHTNITDSTVYNRGKLTQARNEITSHSLSASSGEQTHYKDPIEHGFFYSCYTFAVQWIVPLEIGLYFSVFSTRTSTELVTAVFYVSVLVMFLIAYRKLHSGVRSFLTFVTVCHSELILLGTFTKAALVGLVTLLCYSY